MLRAQLLFVLHYPLFMPSSYPPFAQYAKDDAPTPVVIVARTLDKAQKSAATSVARSVTSQLFDNYFLIVNPMPFNGDLFKRAPERQNISGCILYRVEPIAFWWSEV
jgi:hypothetical protein